VTNPLSPIMGWYEVAQDRMRVTTRVITKKIEVAVTRRHVFHGEDPDRSLSRIGGQVKQIVGYRNWVAHGRSTAEPPDGNVSPRMAFEQLTRFLIEAGIVDPP